MVCKNCGATLQDGMAFCTNCGCKIEAPAPQPAQPQYQQQAQPQYQQQAQPQYQQQPQYQPQYQQPVYQSQSAGPQPSTLAFGILSLVLCWIPILGIIFAAIGRSKGKNYVRSGGQLTGASKVGFILCVPGLIFSIIMNVYYLILIIIAIGAAS